MLETNYSPFQSLKLISLDYYFDEMVKLYESNSFPKVLLLNGKKGIGKFTLIFHFLNYIYSKNENNNYKIKEKLIDSSSNFYNSVLNKTCSDVIFLHAEKGKNIKIDDIRNLKSVLSKSSLSENPRFTIIDEVEFLNANSVNALLKTLEEPSVNNYFILTNNQQADLIETISSRCLKNNVYLNSKQRKKVIDYFVEYKQINLSIDDSDSLTPGLLIKYNDLFNKYKIKNNDNILLKLNKLLYAYKKDKNKNLIQMSIFFVDQYIYHLVKENVNNTDFLLNTKSITINKINDFVIYNLNINSVLNSIELILKNVRQ
mgnify:FL=1